MGFGQYTEETTRTGKDRGFPEGVPLKTGRMTREEIMANVDAKDIVNQKQTGHNEITRFLKDGTIICRLRETDIVTLAGNRSWMQIDTGGWNTHTTRRHVMNFSLRWNFQISVWGDKKVGGNQIQVVVGTSCFVGNFKHKILLKFEEGGVKFESDLED